MVNIELELVSDVNLDQAFCAVARTLAAGRRSHRAGVWRLKSVQRHLHHARKHLDLLANGAGGKTILPTRHADSLWLWNSASEPPRLGPRFQPCLCTGPPRNRIIDLCIALESSLLSDVREELVYRLSLRGAALLAGKRDPEVTRWLLRKIYEARSAVVHDGKSLRQIEAKTRPFVPLCPVTRRNLRGRSTRHSVRLHRPPCRRRVLERNQRRT